MFEFLMVLAFLYAGFAHLLPAEERAEDDEGEKVPRPAWSLRHGPGRGAQRFRDRLRRAANGRPADG